MRGGDSATQLRDPNWICQEKTRCDERSGLESLGEDA